jgi:nitroreductase
MGYKSIIDLLNKRWSVRKFKDKEISGEVIDYIVEAGRLSPSGGNEQPWLFGVINDREKIKSVSEAAYNQKWIATAPLLIILCTKIVEDERGARDIQTARFPHLKDEIVNMEKELYSSLNCEEHQTKIPGTHMCLAALEHGINSTWVSYFKVREVSQILNLPRNIIPSEIIVMGYPDEEFKNRRKKSKEEVLFINSYGEFKKN